MAGAFLSTAASRSEINFEEESMPKSRQKNPQNLNWICSELGQTFFRKVLNTIGGQESAMIEAVAARAIFSHTEKRKSIDVAFEFLKEMSSCFEICYQNIQDVKCLNKKMVNLEKSFVS